MGSFQLEIDAALHAAPTAPEHWYETNEARAEESHGSWLWRGSHDLSISDTE